MKPGQLLSRVRSLDTRRQRYLHSERRRVLVNAGLPMEFSMIAPIQRRLSQDPRVEFFFTSSVHPDNIRRIFADAGEGIRIISPGRAALMKFDAYLAADFTWAKLPRGAKRIQT